MLLLLALTTTFVGLAATLLLGQQAVADRRNVARTLRQADGAGVQAWDLRAQALAEPLHQRVFRPAQKRARDTIRTFAPHGVMTRLDEELTYAGRPGSWDGEKLLVIKAVIAGGLTLTSPLWAPVIGFGGPRLLIVAFLTAFVGWFLPEWILRSRSADRQRAIQRALPDALDLLAITVQAGLGFDAALDRVARQMHGPLAQEFHRVVQEMRLGTSRKDALRGLRDRTNVTELRSFVLALIQADSFGISISAVLQVQAAEIRTRRRQRAEEQAQKLPVKIVMPLMACIFPSLFVVLLGPAALRIYDLIIAS